MFRATLIATLLASSTAFAATGTIARLQISDAGDVTIQSIREMDDTTMRLVGYDGNSILFVKSNGIMGRWTLATDGHMTAWQNVGDAVNIEYWAVRGYANSRVLLINQDGTILRWVIAPDGSKSAKSYGSFDQRIWTLAGFDGSTFLLFKDDGAMTRYVLNDDGTKVVQNVGSYSASVWKPYAYVGSRLYLTNKGRGEVARIKFAVDGSKTWQNLGTYDISIWEVAGCDDTNVFFFRPATRKLMRFLVAENGTKVSQPLYDVPASQLIKDYASKATGVVGTTILRRPVILVDGAGYTSISGTVADDGSLAPNVSVELWINGAKKFGQRTNSLGAFKFFLSPFVSIDQASVKVLGTP